MVREREGEGRDPGCWEGEGRLEEGDRGRPARTVSVRLGLLE